MSDTQILHILLGFVIGYAVGPILFGIGYVLWYKWKDRKR